MFRYRTVQKEGSAERTIEKSKFIGYVRPVETREEAEAFFEEIRSMHRGATHNVPAMVIGEAFNLQWASDDGEPQGTSGAPMVQMLVKEGITNAAIMVTRYFGGIKLGTGGLVRAYTGTAKAALEAAGLCQVREMDILKIKMDYSCYGKLQNLAEEGAFQIRDAVFEDMVILNLAAEPERLGEVRGIVSNLTAGQGIELGIARELVHIPELSKTE
ncbi:MAG: YigZ family protein [Anaerovoracaceae bacterium]|nr:YigZ family protein [Bacillota bacterium]MDY3954171.1 YigZ family protein [Anaerovoracaceae bacterium]